MDGGRSSPPVILSSSSLAYAVSLLPSAKGSTYKAAPPLPKNLAALRFSGALFFEPRSRMGLARCVSENKRSYFHAFTLFKGEGGPLAVDEG